MAENYSKGGMLVKALEIKENVFYVGVQDYDLRVFDIVMRTEYGTSYNAYLVKGREKTVLVETVKDKFFDEYIKDLQEIVKLSEIDYLIMNHTEPDHSGSVEKLLELIPGLTILGSQTAIRFLKEISNKNFSSRELNHGDELDLGGKTLRFISAPFLHWPDSMYSYLPEDKILFTCDSFGSHYADEKVFNDLIDFDFTDAYKYYFDMIMGPFKPYVLEALEKIKDLEFDVICPGHGPVLRQNLDYYIELYRQWSTPVEVAEGEKKPSIVLAYVTAYGYTEMIADSLLEGISMMGDFDIKRYNLVEGGLEEVLQSIDQADGLLVGSPTINGDALPPIWDLITRLSPITHSDKVALAFGAYGWSGEAVPSIESRLNALRMKVLPGFRVNFKPSARQLEDAFTLGMEFARAVMEKGQDKSKIRWRCLVCGHIHVGEEPPAICPACGVGPENFVQMPLEDEFLNDTSEHFVIIGSGIAALSAAQAIRQRNRTAAITMLTEEEALPYYRPALSDFLGEDLPDKRLYVFNAAWYQENAIEVKTGFKVNSIDTAARKVSGDNGENLTYNKLIVASGARSNIPPFPGVEKEGVFALRNLKDAIKLKEAIKTSKKAVVIGGGVLGLEAVWEMVSAGLEVSVVEFGERLMPRQLDDSSSARLADIIRSKGVQLYLGKATEEILGEARASGVRLNDGQVLEADLVLLSTGVKPNVELAQEAGLEIKQGIVVDEKMRSSVPDVYAAGDVAQHGERMIGLWPIAMEMGRIAGAAAAGDWLEYKEPRISTMLVAFDKEIFSIGEVNLPPEQCRVVEVKDPIEDYYKKSFIKDGVLVGEIIIASWVDSSESVQKLGRDKSGKQRHNRWKCRLCGYIHEGPEPPDICPVCGAPKDMFDPID
ncbi:putative flavoprotein [Syntrophomonas wolfei subsp. wolfei str. Goettingen G311]|uniref:Putative flavoprotein n=1 Tax=Syntrophomonas wolfei subsp. wolfei (strain DSM 2245B / Goettingen) TaxID=335541 RepID=Q0AVA6_SYNWW|nr:putative flavoprotein [Syntrophomonas wolfei subsp. wolfei str. Goettingen G311]